MGFHWKPTFVARRTRHGHVAACPDCGTVVTDLDGEPVSPVALDAEEYRRKCGHCATPLWTLMRPRTLSGSDQSSAVLKALKRIPTIGEVTAQKLMRKFGDGFLASMLGDNIHEFINLMDGDGELVFSDRQAARMERAMANMEFGFGEGAATSPANSSNATCRTARSICSSPTRRTSTRTEAAPRARPWACSHRSAASRWRSPAR